MAEKYFDCNLPCKQRRVNKGTVYPGHLITEVESGKMPQMRRAPDLVMCRGLQFS